MNIAIVDCGTNTFNLLVAEATAEGWKTLFSNKLPVKLGAGGFSENRITSSRYIRGLDALNSHRQNVTNFGCSRAFAFATSAIREASNGSDFVSDALKFFGLEVEVISGEKEAELICEGVCQAMDTGTDPALIMDIGGGSTEFIIASASKVLWKRSYLLGISRIHEKLQPETRLDHRVISEFRKLMDAELQDLRHALQQFPCTTLIGSSGSFDTLAELFMNEVEPGRQLGLSTEIPLDRFASIHTWLMGSTYEERKKHPVIPEIRAEYMPLASLMVKYILDMYPFRQLKQSSYSLKEGALARVLRTIDWSVEQEAPKKNLEEED